MNPSQLIDEQIHALAGWRGEMLLRLRSLIHDADPEIVEQWKWGTAVFDHHGLVCATGSFKDHVKLNFFNGADLPDPDGLFNAGLDAKKTRAIDLFEDSELREGALRALIHAAVARNLG